jgi:hypothetical protein
VECQIGTPSSVTVKVSPFPGSWRENDLHPFSVCDQSDQQSIRPQTSNPPTNGLNTRVPEAPELIIVDGVAANEANGYAHQMVDAGP